MKKQKKNIVYNIKIQISLFCICILLCSCKKAVLQTNRFITDMEGNKIELPMNIERVACISQSATDLMIGFGLSNKIVGTYRSFLYNPWASLICKNVEQYKSYSYSVSVEELIKDRIQLVILQDTENAEKIRNAGIPVVAVHQFAMDGKYDDEIFEIAKIISEIFPEVKNKAEKWIEDIKTTIKEISTVTTDTNESNMIYYVNGEKAKGLYYSDGGNSMIEYLLSIVNQQLVTAKYNVLNVHNVSDEEMIKLNPYAMLIGGSYQNKLIKELSSSVIWSSLDCYKNNRVYRIPVCMVGIENVSIETPIMLKYLANLFCGCKYDIIEEIRKTVKEYYNYDLSSDDVDSMLSGLFRNNVEMINE